MSDPLTLPMRPMSLYYRLRYPDLQPGAVAGARASLLLQAALPTYPVGPVAPERVLQVQARHQVQGRIPAELWSWQGHFLHRHGDPLDALEVLTSRDISDRDPRPHAVGVADLAREQIRNERLVLIAGIVYERVPEPRLVRFGEGDWAISTRGAGFGLWEAADQVKRLPEHDAKSARRAPEAVSVVLPYRLAHDFRTDTAPGAGAFRAWHLDVTGPHGAAPLGELPRNAGVTEPIPDALTVAAAWSEVNADLLDEKVRAVIFPSTPAVPVMDRIMADHARVLSEWWEARKPSAPVEEPTMG